MIEAPSHLSTMDAAHEILHRVFGYTAFRGHQGDAIAHVVDGGDALVLMPTGAGKSLCYQIPALVRGQRGLGCGVVVSPLIALMQDQVSALKESGVRAAFLNSTQSTQRAAEVEHAFRSGALDLLYVAPERLLTDRCLQLLSSAPVSLFAIDEAHCVSQWGHDFRPEYMQLELLGERFPGVPRIALTATADPATRVEIVLQLGLSDARLFVSSFDRPNIRYEIVEKIDARRQLLAFMRAEHEGEAGIVYCLSRRKVDETAAFLVEQGIKAMPYHAGMDSDSRQQNQSRFLREDGMVMVATIAFGMGIDKPDVRFVAHLDLPKSIEGYYQETGRGGRDGAPADAWMAYGLQDVVQLRRMIDGSEGSEQYKRVSSGKLDAMLGLCETASCRRARLLAYFGEDDAIGSPTGLNCGNCDNCIAPPQTFDATVAVQQLLSCIYRLMKERGQSFGAMHVIAILRGDNTARSAEKIAQWNHDTLSTFGIGAERSDAEWRAIVRQCIAAGFVDIDHATYGTLHLTAKSRAVLRGEEQIMLRRFQTEAKREGRRKKTQTRGRASFDLAEGLDAQAAVLFDALRAWRLAAAREHGVPAYVIFHDGTLKDIARLRPTSPATLAAIPGVGAKKLEAYGDDLVAVVERHLKDPDATP